jgi:hypothetical protein
MNDNLKNEIAKLKEIADSGTFETTVNSDWKSYNLRINGVPVECLSNDTIDYLFRFEVDRLPDLLVLMNSNNYLRGLTIN